MEIFEALRERRVPAGPVWNMAELHADAQLRARRFFETTRHPEIGAWEIHGWAWRNSGAGPCLIAPAPEFGQHNAEILGGLLGLSEAEIAGLKERQIVADAPIGVLPTSQMDLPPV